MNDIQLKKLTFSFLFLQSLINHLQKFYRLENGLFYSLEGGGSMFPSTTEEIIKDFIEKYKLIV